MATSPVVFGVYQPETSASGIVLGRLQTQVRTWLPVLAFSMIFAVESTSFFGSDRTSAPLESIAEAIFGYGVGLHWELIHHLIRKTGHFMGYGVFCLICFRAFWIEFQSVASWLSRQLRAHGLAILSTFIVASADEFHQSFLPNRTGQFSDVLLDTCGGLALGFMLFLAMQRRQAGLRRSAKAAA